MQVCIAQQYGLTPSWLMWIVGDLNNTSIQLESNIKVRTALIALHNAVKYTYTHGGWCDYSILQLISSKYIHFTVQNLHLLFLGLLTIDNRATQHWKLLLNMQVSCGVNLAIYYIKGWSRSLIVRAIFQNYEFVMSHN